MKSDIDPPLPPPVVTPAAMQDAFDPATTPTFQARMPAAPNWFSSMVAGNNREKNRLRAEIGHDQQPSD